MPVRHLTLAVTTIFFAACTLGSLSAVELTLTDANASTDQIHISQAGTTVTVSDTPTANPRVVAYPDVTGMGRKPNAYPSAVSESFGSVADVAPCNCGSPECSAGGGYETAGSDGWIYDDACGGGCSDGCSSCCADGCSGSCGGCGSWWDFFAGAGSGQGIVLDFWLDQGYTWNPDDPRNDFNLPVTFNDRANEYQMNQLYLALGREVSTSGHWDIGGRVDLLYGTDYFFTQALGLEVNTDGSPRWNSSNGPRGTGASMYGLAMPQLYAEVFAPIGPGIRVKAGHFYTTIGYESVMAPENFFYSHSYTMQYGEPFTHTGLLAQFSPTRRLDIHAGFTRGWDNWEDPNGQLGFLGGLAWTAPSELASIALTVTSSNEDLAGRNNRTLYSLVYARRFGCRWRYVLQHDFGTDEGARIDANDNLRTAKWYGVNNYLFFDLSDRLSLGMRYEWFRDRDNARVLGIPIQSLVSGSDYNAFTFGSNWQISPRLTLRKEVRFDWSDVEVRGRGVYDDFSDKNQTTVATDLIFRF